MIKLCRGSDECGLLCSKNFKTQFPCSNMSANVQNDFASGFIYFIAETIFSQQVRFHSMTIISNL